MTAYATAAELASWLDVPNEGTELALATETASRVIDRYCGREFDDDTPTPIKVATLMQAAKFYERRGNISGPMTSKQVDDVRYGWSNPSAVPDSDVAAILAAFRAWWWAA